MASKAHTSAVASAGSRRAISDGSGSGTPSAVWRAAPAGLAALGGCGLLLALAWRDGGYFPEGHLLPGAIAFGLLAVLLAVRPPYFALSTGALIAVSALAGFVAWTAASSHWSSAPDVALEDFQRGLAYLGILGLGLMAAGSGRYSRQVVWLTFAVIVVVAGAGLVSRLQPDWINPASTFSRFGGYRLAYPLGYWNAFGALGAMGVVLGAGLAGDPRSPVVLRALASAATVIVGTAAYLSFSRGAWLAFFLGIAVLLALGAHRTSLLASLAICGTALVATVGRLAAYPALTERPGAGEGALIEGDAYLPFLIGVAVLAAVAQVMASGHWLPGETRAVLVRMGRPLGAGLVIAALLAAGVFYAVRAGDVEGGSAARLQQAEDWLDRQWDEFMTPAAVGSVSGAERLTTARGTRSDLYRVAIDGFEARPLWGDGSGGFEYRFAHDRDVQEKVRDAHSLYLETAGELGLVGLLLLLGFLGAVGYAVVVARRRGGALPGAQAAAAGAALAVWAGHAGVDWDWQVPALTGTALFLAGAVFPAGRGRRRRRHRDDAESEWGRRLRRRMAGR